MKLIEQLIEWTVKHSPASITPAMASRLLREGWVQDDGVNYPLIDDLEQIAFQRMLETIASMPYQKLLDLELRVGGKVAGLDPKGCWIRRVWIYAYHSLSTERCCRQEKGEKPRRIVDAERYSQVGIDD